MVPKTVAKASNVKPISLKREWMEFARIVGFCDDIGESFSRRIKRMNGEKMKNHLY
ncbi:hypothetical protein CFELI_12160 [Corynebacterium felinum]|uniref:Uncharacterized protein n=1 Tax=Corynebacterium felinum TaxID=131318 RepID=A0ABU2B5E1_9CORY|nr:hypothetical protein [Corynebacterium felinum]WJY96013.1 hypothetical protein CFELI_12160 [Corynebacterium felinum]